MRSLFLLPVTALLYYAFLPYEPQTANPVHFAYTDTVKINHKLDGLTTEWPDKQFETNTETGIRYAVDNDSEFLYVAMRIQDERTQVKLMRLGMKFFIDLKGKKKENMGIEFPIKIEHPVTTGENEGRRNQEGGEQKGPDIKTVKKMLALNLLYMRVFGFEGESKPEDQGLLLADKANLAFAWDPTNMMHIEYRVPLKLIDKVAALKEKTISIGWKLNGVEMNPNGGFNESSAGGEGRGGGGRGGEGRGGRGGSGGYSGRGGGNQLSPEQMQSLMKENNFWTKYTFNFDSPKKGF